MVGPPPAPELDDAEEVDDDEADELLDEADELLESLPFPPAPLVVVAPVPVAQAFMNAMKPSAMDDRKANMGDLAKKSQVDDNGWVGRSITHRANTSIDEFCLADGQFTISFVNMAKNMEAWANMVYGSA